MTTTTIRTTCDSCQLTFHVPSTAIVLALPSPAADAAPSPASKVCARPATPCRAAR